MVHPQNKQFTTVKFFTLVPAKDDCQSNVGGVAKIGGIKIMSVGVKYLTPLQHIPKSLSSGMNAKLDSRNVMINSFSKSGNGFKIESVNRPKIGLIKSPQNCEH